jgi:hypothetical protein
VHLLAGAINMALLTEGDFTKLSSGERAFRRNQSQLTP